MIFQMGWNIVLQFKYVYFLKGAIVNKLISKWNWVIKYSNINYINLLTLIFQIYYWEGIYCAFQDKKIQRYIEVSKLYFVNFRSGKKSLCNESISAKKNGRLSLSAVPPPIPMSPIVEKMEGLKAIRNRSNSLRLGRLAFYRHLEKVETMRSFWELKHEEMERGQQQVTCSHRR